MKQASSKGSVPVRNKTLAFAVLVMPICAVSALQDDMAGQWKMETICCGIAGVPMRVNFKEILVVTKDSVHEYRNDTLRNAQRADDFIAFWTSGGRRLSVRNDSLFKDTVAECCDIPNEWVYERMPTEVKSYPSFDAGKKQNGKESYFDISGRSIRPQFLLRNRVYVAKNAGSGLKRVFIKAK
jgi:hypothetical protein